MPAVFISLLHACAANRIERARHNRVAQVRDIGQGLATADAARLIGAEGGCRLGAGIVGLLPACISRGAAAEGVVEVGQIALQLAVAGAVGNVRAERVRGLDNSGIGLLGGVLRDRAYGAGNDGVVKAERVGEALLAAADPARSVARVPAAVQLVWYACCHRLPPRVPIAPPTALISTLSVSAGTWPGPAPSCRSVRRALMLA